MISVNLRRFEGLVMQLMQKHLSLVEPAHDHLIHKLGWKFDKQALPGELQISVS